MKRRDDSPTRVVQAPPKGEVPSVEIPQDHGAHAVATPAAISGALPPQATPGSSDTSPLQRFASSHHIIPQVSPGHDADADPSPRGPGDARYAFGPELGSGGIGHVHLATDRDLRRAVAVKSLRDEHKTDPLLLRAFLEEAIITGGLCHPNIVPVYEVGVSELVGPYYAMKRIVGRPLSEVLSELRAGSGDLVPLPRLIEFFAQTLRAIAHAHARGVVHCDLKPANIIIGAYGEVTVIDWGLAKVMGQQGRWQARAQLWSGSPGYMAPEQALSSDIDTLDTRADIWSLGAILYELLCWTMPFADGEGKVSDDLQWKAIPEPSARPWAKDIPKDLAALAMRALAKEAGDRPQSVLEILAEVESWLDGSREARHRDEVAEGAVVEMRKSAKSAAMAPSDAAALSHWELASRHLAAALIARPTHPLVLGEAAKAYWQIFTTIYPGGRATGQDAETALGLLAKVLELAPCAVVNRTIADKRNPPAEPGDAWLNAALSISDVLNDDGRLRRLLQRIQLLASTAIFSKVGASRLLPIADACQDVHLAKGDLLFRQGDRGDALYIVAQGQIRIDSEGLTLATVDVGGCFGEIAIIDGCTRSACATAQSDCVLLSLTAERFETLIRGGGGQGDIGLSVMRFLTASLRAATEREARRPHGSG